LEKSSPFMTAKTAGVNSFAPQQNSDHIPSELIGKLVSKS